MPSTRATVDIDLFRSGYSLDEALADLRRLAEIDLADLFRFVYTRHRAIVAGDAQPHTDGYRVVFDTYICVQKKSSIGIDLSIGAGLTAEVTVMAPATALDLPRLAACDYRLYPVVDQIADKVCATMQLYAGRPSSREKDLVDLVVLAVTHDIDGAALEVAIRTEALRRGMEPFDRFVVPTGWGPAYKRAATSVPYCKEFRSIETASELATAFVDPVLDGSARGKAWQHTQLAWVARASRPRTHHLCPTRLLAPHHARADDEARSLLHEIFAGPADLEIIDDQLHVRINPLTAPLRTARSPDPALTSPPAQPPTPAPTYASSTAPNNPEHPIPESLQSRDVVVTHSRGERRLLRQRSRPLIHRGGVLDQVPAMLLPVLRVGKCRCEVSGDP